MTAPYSAIWVMGGWDDEGLPRGGASVATAGSLPVAVALARDPLQQHLMECLHGPGEMAITDGGGRRVAHRIPVRGWYERAA